jgi:membrane peptidoglycan carboxypeptidase
MKKIFILSIIASAFIACNNAPKVTESATKVVELTSWVDSIKNVIGSTTSYDTATWVGYSESFNGVLASVNETELDEASKTALESVKTSWTELTNIYTKGLEAAAMKANEAKDSTIAELPTSEATVDQKTVLEKVKEAVKK